ncbi:MAG TPA: transcription antitermination factor NusB [Vicinamibacterales bacterium]|nr:transcription antitermination factor NusB [Vicinamibacterales bacterium]
MTTGPRHRAREAALQILYFWEVGRASPDEALAAFWAEHEPEAPEPLRAFAADLVHGTIAEVGALDAVVAAHSANWRLDRLAVIDRMILRMAVWEMRHEQDTPAAVVIDEAIELARTFSTDDSVRFVNGVLDAIRKAQP